MRATKLPLRPTYFWYYLARGYSLLIPKFSSAKRPKSLWKALLSASVFRSIRVRNPRVPQIWEGLRVKKIVKRLKVTGHLNPNHCSRLGNGQQTKVEGILKGGHVSPLTQSSGWKMENKGAECL